MFDSSVENKFMCSQLFRSFLIDIFLVGKRTKNQLAAVNGIRTSEFVKFAEKKGVITHDGKYYFLTEEGKFLADLADKLRRIFE